MATELPKDQKCDWIGPADSNSKLRQVKAFIPSDESQIERIFRLQQEENHFWNEQFWSKHNAAFYDQQKKFMSLHAETNKEDPIDSTKMSEFYKQFLDERWDLHYNYNKEWYKKNLSMLWPAFRVSIYRLLKRLPRL